MNKISMPEMASILMQIAEIIPFGKRNMYSNPMTEGGKRYEGGGKVIGLPAPQKPGPGQSWSDVPSMTEMAASRGLLGGPKPTQADLYREAFFKQYGRYPEAE
jgi:hypothetical protein